MKFLSTFLFLFALVALLLFGLTAAIFIAFVVTLFLAGAAFLIGYYQLRYLRRPESVPI